MFFHRYWRKGRVDMEWEHVEVLIWVLLFYFINLWIKLRVRRCGMGAGHWRKEKVWQSYLREWVDEETVLELLGINSDPHKALVFQRETSSHDLVLFFSHLSLCGYRYWDLTWFGVSPRKYRYIISYIILKFKKPWKFSVLFILVISANHCGAASDVSGHEGCTNL